MKKQSLLFVIIFIILQAKVMASGSDYKVIPLPNHIQTLSGSGFVLNGQTKICYSPHNREMRHNARFLSEYLQQLTHKLIEVSEKEAKTNVIILKQGEMDSKNKEAYKILVDSSKITILGNTPAGVFYGIQTLRKAAPQDAPDVSYSPVIIEDEPRFAYRGMHLDVARHFFPVDFIKTYLDILALHNVNTFHWHLTDDQGWRIEIKKYPKLTEIGSIRKETIIGHARTSTEFDHIPYGGYYTQDQIREIVKYAKDRYITVIPEVDLPGHMLAALAAYPELGCTGGPYEVGTKWGIFDDVLCPGKETTFKFLEETLSEVCKLFPSKYIHIGGDECPKTRWQSCPSCQHKINELGLKDDKERKDHTKEFYLQSYVTERITKFLDKKGKKVIGWDEIMEDDKLGKNVTVMSWRGEMGGIDAAKTEHDVIMTPNSYLYFDHYQTKDLANEPLAIGGYLPIDTVYTYNPVTPKLLDNEKKYILGAQANLWTEYIPTINQVEYMLLPRLAALSEVQWTQPENKNYQSFMDRIQDLLKMYDNLGYTYSKHIFDPKPADTTKN